MGLEISVGNPPEPGRYVVWSPCKALQAREWCEPSIATWHDGKWASFEPVWGWIGPLPVVHGNDCLEQFQTFFGSEILESAPVDPMRIIVATNAEDAIRQIDQEYDL